MHSKNPAVVAVPLPVFHTQKATQITKSCHWISLDLATGAQWESFPWICQNLNLEEDMQICEQPENRRMSFIFLFLFPAPPGMVLGKY